MTNIPAFTPVRGEVILPISAEAESRVGNGYSVLDGLAGAEQGTPNMTIAIAAGTVRLAFLPKSYAGGNATIDASNVSLDRKDIIYIDVNGALGVWKGDNLAKVDPQGNSNWKEYTSPYPKASCPSGVPLYEVYIVHGATVIHTTDLRSLARYDPNPRGPWVLPPVLVTNGGGASQAIFTTPNICEIEEIIVTCLEASATRTVNIGWSGSTSILMSDSEVPHTLNGVKAIRWPSSEQTASKVIIATVGGSGATGQWNVWLKLSRYT